MTYERFVPFRSYSGKDMNSFVCSVNFYDKICNINTSFSHVLAQRGYFNSRCGRDI